MRLAFRRRDPHDDLPLPPAFGADLDRGVAADPEAIARVRAHVTAEFRRQAATGSGPRPAMGATRPASFGQRPALRPVASIGLAAALLLGSFGLVAANSGPGDAFYDLRLAAQGFNLLGPTTHLERLQERLSEVSRVSGYPAAVSVALKAYRDELQRALDAATDTAGQQAILDALEAHRVVLEALAGTVPNAAANGLEQALSQLGKAQEAVRDKQDARDGNTGPVASATPKRASPERTSRPEPTRRPSPR